MYIFYQIQNGKHIEPIKFVKRWLSSSGSGSTTDGSESANKLALGVNVKKKIIKINRRLEEDFSVNGEHLSFKVKLWSCKLAFGLINENLYWKFCLK